MPADQSEKTLQPPQQQPMPGVTAEMNPRPDLPILAGRRGSAGPQHPASGVTKCYPSSRSKLLPIRPAAHEIRVNAVAPGPVWTPLIPSTLPPDAVASFGSNVPMKRPAQPAELATAFVMLADPLSSYTSGATVAVIGGRPLI